MSVTYSPVNVEYINPFLSSALNVFRTMLDCEIKRGKPFLKGGPQPDHDISGIIGLTGEAIGTVVLSLGRQTALTATSRFLGEMPTEISDDVVDTIGELTNMIAGSAKAQLESLEMSISLPNVIVGRNHTVSFPSGVTPVGLPLECEWGPASMMVGLCEVGEPGG